MERENLLILSVYSVLKYACVIRVLNIGAMPVR